MPRRRPRLVATDLDGTLLRPDGTFPVRALTVLSQLRRGGVETVFATARHASAVARLGVPADLVREAVVCCGAGRYLLGPGRITDPLPLTPGACAAVVDRLRDAVPGIRFGWVMPRPYDDVAVEPGYASRPVPGVRTAAVSGLRSPVLKLFARAAQGPAAGFRDVVESALRGVAEIAHHADGFVDLVRPGVSKAEALERLCAARGIAAADVLAFGDTAADLPMIRWAGWGVAVANAERPLLAAADDVTGSCDRDGVVDYLRERFRLR